MRRIRSHVSKKSFNQSLYPSIRYTILRPVLTIWQGSIIRVLRNRRNSIFNTCSPLPTFGINMPNHALRFQANDAITMYAQLLTKSLTGNFIAFTPFFNCSITFS